MLWKPSASLPHRPADLLLLRQLGELSRQPHPDQLQFDLLQPLWPELAIDQRKHLGAEGCGAVQDVDAVPGAVVDESEAL